MTLYSYEIAAIFLEAIIIFAIFFRKTTLGKSNRLFLILNFQNLFVCLIDVANGMLRNHLPDNPVAMGFSFFLSSVYFLFRNATTVVFFYFLLYYFRLDRLTRNVVFMALFNLPIVALLALLIANPFNHWIFNTTVENGYVRGDDIWICYLISAIYLTAGLVLLLFTRKSVEVSKILALLSNYIVTLIAVGVQLYQSRLMVELLSTALAFMLITIVVLRPEEVVEPKTGLPSYESFRKELLKAVSFHQDCVVLFLRVRNVSDLKAFFGEDGFFSAVRRFNQTLYHLQKEAGCRLELYFELPNMMYVIASGRQIDEQKLFGLIDRRAKEDVMVSDDGTYTASMNFIGSSLVLQKTELSQNDILRFAHSYDLYMKKGVYYTKSEEIIQYPAYIVSVNLSDIIKRGFQNHSFEMYYQPIYDIKTQTFHSAEALIRLNDEKYGFISPGLFIPAAEKRHLLRPISDFVLDSVYRFIGSHDLNILGIDFIEVNLSVQQCIDPNLIDQITKLAEKYHVLPSQINFEITKSVYSQPNQILTRNLEALTALGYALSMDDYGTGYSNMNRLISMPLSIIKADKSLVDASVTKEGMTVLSNAIHMILDIHKIPLIEGVETKEQVDALQAMGARYIQGWCFSKALPANDYLDYVRQHNPM